MEQYTPTQDELKLQARFTLTGTMHEWGIADKLKYISYLNKRAGLPLGTIGMIRTEHKNKDGTLTVKEIPYASRQTTVELGRMHKISLEQTKEFFSDSMVRYTYRATDVDTGRYVDAVGACSLAGWGDKPLSADAKANKFMHAETKAKRRATLEVCGLAFLDDTEVDDIEGAKRIDIETGEVEQPAPKSDAASTPASHSAAPSAAAVSASASTAATGSPAPTASAPQSNAPAKTEFPKGSAILKPAAPSAVAAPSAPAPASTFEAPCPIRFEANKHLFVAATPETIVADAEHSQFIVHWATKEAGWASKDLAEWLFSTFGVRGKNMSETLTLDVFARIMGGIDQALTSAGR